MTGVPGNVSDWFGAAHCLPVGSGTVGLTLVLQAAGGRGRRVLIPALACPNVAVAVLAAGAIPVLVDMEPKTYDFAELSLKRALDDRVAAIIAIDTFGRPANITAIEGLSLPDDCLIIEDACQAYGGAVEGMRLGTRGHVGVVSFGYAKPLDLMGGGLVTTYDDCLANKIRVIMENRAYQMFPALKNRFALKLMMENNYQSMVDRNSYHGLLKYQFPKRILGRLGQSFERWLDELEQTAFNIGRVRTLVDTLPGVKSFHSDADGWLAWRYSVRVPDADAREALLKQLINYGIHSTQLYRPVDEFLDVELSGDIKAARSLAVETINIAYRMTQKDTSLLVEKLELLKS